MNNAQILDAQKSFDQKLGTFIWPYSYGLSDSQKTHDLFDESFARMAELGLNYCVLGMTYANFSRDEQNNYHASTEPINQYAIESALRNNVIPIVSYGMWSMADFDQDIFNHDQQTFLNAITEIHCRLIRRYKGQQILWEGLNEPDNGATPWFNNEGPTNSDRVRQIVQLNTTVAKQVKQDPAMLYFGGNFFTYPADAANRNSDWQPYLDDGMLTDSDAFANHPYGNKPYWNGKPEYVFENWKPGTYAPISGLPYVTTEYGYSRNEFDDTTIANYIARQSVLLDAMGYSLFTVYGFDMSGASPWSMVNADGSYNQTSTQLLNLRDELTGYHFDHWASSNIGGLMAATYVNATMHKRYVYWAPDNAQIVVLNDGQDAISVDATHTAQWIDGGTQTISSDLKKRINQEVWYVNQVLNQAVRAVNKLYGTEELQPILIESCKSRYYDRQLRLEMLSGFIQMNDQVNCVTEAVNRMGLNPDGPLDSISVSGPRGLAFDNDFWITFDQSMATIHQRLFQFKKILKLADI